MVDGKSMLLPVWVRLNASLCVSVGGPCAASPCNALAGCIDLVNSFGCGPFVIPGSLSPGVGAIRQSATSVLLSTSAGGSIIRFQINPGNFSVTQVYYGSSMIGATRYRCRSFTVQQTSAALANVSCVTAAGVGSNLMLTIEFCPPNLICITSSDSSASFSYPSPTIRSFSIRYAGTSATSSDLALSTSLPASVSFDGSVRCLLCASFMRFAGRASSTTLH